MTGRWRWRPGTQRILFYRAQALRRLDRCEEALADLDQTLTRKPDFAPAYNLRGETLASLARYDEAAAQFELALKHDPKFMPARLNLGLTRLLRGDFHRGWRDYEFRWSNPRAERREFRAPLWLGEESLVGKTILLHAEQGFGDTIQFARYAPLAAERGAKVILEVQAELKTLMSRTAGVAAVLGQPEERTRESRIDGAPVPLAREQGLPPFDCHCPLLSLPLAFKTDLDTVPAGIPYLGADPERAHIWRARLGQRRSPLIGLAWSGNPFHWQDRNRSIALNCLAPLLSQPLSFVSLQKAVSETDARLMAGLPNLMHLGDELADFDDTAAVIELVGPCRDDRHGSRPFGRRHGQADVDSFAPRPGMALDARSRRHPVVSDRSIVSSETPRRLGIRHRTRARVAFRLAARGISPLADHRTSTLAKSRLTHGRQFASDVGR